MSDPNDTSTIDEKKDENNGNTKKDNNIGGVIWAFVMGLIGVYIYCLLCLRVCVCVGVCQREMERGTYGDSMYLYFYQVMYEYYVTNSCTTCTL